MSKTVELYIVLIKFRYICVFDTGIEVRLIDNFYLMLKPDIMEIIVTNMCSRNTIILFKQGHKMI
jgi:hypothetical protein